MSPRHFSVFIGFFALLLVFSGCSENTKIPGIQFLTKSYEFGIIDEGKTLTHVFEFKNTGTGTLKITAVRPTCGCTVANDYDKEVEAGKTGKISITFDSSDFDGPIMKPVIVKSNAPETPEIILSLSGTVNVSIGLNPKILSFGTIQRDRKTALTGAISISNRISSPFKVLEVLKLTEESGKPNLTITNKNVETRIKTLNQGYEYSLVVTVNPPFKYGKVSGNFLIKTDSEKSPELKTGYSYHMEPLVKVYPNPLYINPDHIKKGISQQINIEGEADYEMNITDYTVNSSEINLSLKEIEPHKRYKITIEFPKTFKFDLNHTLAVTFKVENVPDQPLFGIPLLEMR